MTITKLLYHPIIVVSLTLAAIAFFFSLDKTGKKTQNSSENISVLEYEINQISKEVIGLEERIVQTESEQFKEKVVRNELLLQKSGEYILQIPDIQQDQTNMGCENEVCEETTVVIEKNPIALWKKLLF